MRQWVAEPELNLEIVTGLAGWKPDLVKGFHHVRFENHGTIYRGCPTGPRITRVAFRLSRLDDGETSLNLELENVPNESILRHLDFYWGVTIQMLKQFVEKSRESNQQDLNT